MITYKTIDAYIAQFPPNVQVLLEQVRTTIHEAAPQATETIAYGIPTFRLNGNLVHFGAFTHHIGFYPTSSPMSIFAKELEPYQCSKGAIQFPIHETMPLDLIHKIVLCRVQENMNKKK